MIIFKNLGNISRYGRKGQKCLQGRLLLQHTWSDHLPVLCFIFPEIFYWPEISPSQFFFQIVTMILKENNLPLVGVINGNLVSEWLMETVISKILLLVHCEYKLNSFPCLYPRKGIVGF